MAERVHEYTEQVMRVRQRDEALKMIFVLAKNHGHPEDAARDAEALFPRTSIAENVKATVAAGDTTTPGWAAELSYLRFISELVSHLNAASLLSLPWWR